MFVVEKYRNRIGQFVSVLEGTRNLLTVLQLLLESLLSQFYFIAFSVGNSAPLRTISVNIRGSKLISMAI